MVQRAKRIVVAIDGPAGSGKSTVSKRIAKSLGLLYIDTGAMYRALTLKAMRSNANMEDEDALISLAGAAKIDLKKTESRLKVELDGEDVTDLIRTVEVTNNVKHIARVPGVRAKMVSLQRAIGRRCGAVLEGRDIGTVVFPDADYKFYLDADLGVRARRRFSELVEAKQDVRIEDIKADVETRDKSDMDRAVGPLKKSADAVLVDTTNLSVDEVVEKLLSYIERL